MRGSVPRSPHVLLALVVVVWAGSYAAIKRLIDDGLAAPDIALGRYIVAAPGIALAMAVAIGQERFSRRRTGGLAISFANVHGPLLVVAAPIAFAAYNDLYVVGMALAQ